MPDALLDGDYGCFSILAGNTLDALDSLLAVLTVGDSEGGHLSVCERDGISIHVSVLFRERDIRDAVTDIPLYSLCLHTGVLTVYVPEAADDGYYRSVSVGSGRTLYSLNTADAVLSVLTVSDGEGGGLSVGVCDGVGIYKSVTRCNVDRCDALYLVASREGKYAREYNEQAHRKTYNPFHTYLLDALFNLATV